ncbi:hypothetical protein [Fontibacillus sp. BL9]|uniref:hypothetical protein n=1 Tax=Fontibacillus sp. BL9 TaxID=3389971 RepID=UPI00397B1FAB
MQKMFEAVVNSPKTELVVAITEVDTEIEVSDSSVLLQPEGLAVIGNGEGAETIRYTEVDGNVLKGCIRGFQGTAKPWATGTRLARNFTAYDHNTFKANIEKHDTDITALSDRLDIANTDPVTLQPGLQVIHAERDARFRLGEIKGRTLINLLGNAGDCESASFWTAANPAIVVVDTNNKVSGSSSIKVTIGASTTIGSARTNMLFDMSTSKHYLICGWIKNGTATSGALAISGSQANIDATKTSVVTDTTKFNFVYRKVTGFSASGVSVAVIANGAAGQYVYGDEIRIYEINATQYAEIDSMTAEQVAAKYPYTGSGIVGVENPYAIGYGENLLPPFYDSWAASTNASLSIISDYEIVLRTSGTAQEFVHLPSYPVLRNTTYTFSAEHNAGLNIHAPGKGTIASNVRAGYVTFNSGDATAINIGFVDGGASGGVAGEYRIKNPMLVIGSELKPFKPQRNTMLALQTELYANPADGSEPDVLFEREGQYFKLAKWKRNTLDGSLNWIHSLNLTDAKVLRSPSYATNALNAQGQGTLVKWNGVRMGNLFGSVGLSWKVADLWQINAGDLWISISNSESGWGVDYIPTADEIKAYFMGWKMCVAGGSRIDPYNGTGTKNWYPITRINDAYDAQYNRTTVPTDQAPNKDGYTPYQLLYRLAKETVEPVVSEGALRLNEGGNLIEVGTVIVLRERANPKLESGTNQYWINIVDSLTSLANQLESKTGKILAVYRDSRQDFKWNIAAVSPYSYGAVSAVILAANFDPFAAYSVTYTKLDKSPIQSITGSLATNEKAQISDLTAGVAEALQRVSVVEQKKAEKDSPAPVWITPTLLNGWINYDLSQYDPVGFYKDSFGEVHLRGMIGGGAVTPGTVLFRLPEGYRPKKHKALQAMGSIDGLTVSSTFLVVTPLGEVNILRGANNGYLSLCIPTFSAEQ